MFQSLEGRLLLALTPDAGGVLTINGTTGNDKFEVIESSPGIYRLRNLANDAVDFSTGNVTALLVDLGSGNDLLRLRRFDGSLGVLIPATVFGGLGNDTITGGDGDDRLSGQDGDDRLDGRLGADRIFGNSGYDTADYGTRGENLVITLDSVANDGASGEGDDVRTEAVLGGSGNDQIFGDDAANVLDGGDGNDKLAGGLGNDSLTGGAGADSVWGEDGNDFLTARDTILDRINDGTGTDFARVDALLAGDPVDDVPLTTLPPSPSSLSTLSLMSSFAFASFGPAASSAFIGSGIDGLDKTFGSDGRLVTMLDGSLAQINDVALQRVEVSPGSFEDKIVVVGTALGSVGDYDFLVIRYNADGTLDASFGPAGTGIVTTDFANGSGFNTDVASSLVVDAAGRLVVAGGSLKRADLDNSTLQGFADFAVARYLPDGRLDTSFDSDGLVTADPGGPQSDDRASAIAIQRLNVGGVIVEKYVVVGTLGLAFKNANPNFPTADIGMMRLNADGSHDSQFGSVRTEFIPRVSQDFATGVAVDPSNANIWVSGYTGSAAGGFDLALVGYGSGGAFIGSTTVDLGASEEASDIVLDGARALLVGTSSDAWSSSGLIASFNISGADPFVAPGDLMASSIVSDGATAVRFHGVTINNDGRGVAVGAIGDGVSPSDFFVYRFDAETLASDDVYAITDFGGTADGAYAAVVQPDGKVLVAGLSGDDAALARYDLERPLAEFLLTAEEEQAWQFTYDENGQILTLPIYLIDRLRSPLSPDGVLTINGSDDDDVISVSQSGGLITLDKNGQSASYDESLVTRIVFNGYDGDDLFAADPGVSIPLSLKGGAGDDTLLGGAADDEVLGGDGHDVLVGGDGADLLGGGAGNDILIGGNGADSLAGGEGEDILIGGYTKHDRDLVALTAIQAEWTSPTSYSNRVANLGGAGAGTGLNGTYHLRPGSPTVKTIFDDGAVDELSGGDGLDWFIVRTKSPADLLLDRTKGESVAQV